MRGAVVGLLVATAFVLSGCQYLLGPMMGGPVVMPGGSFDPSEFGSFDPGEFDSFDPNDPGFSPPPAIATYSKGSARLTIDGKTTALDALTGDAAVYEEIGADVGWTDGKGLFVRFFGEPGSAFGAGFVTIDRIADGKHWTTADPSGCKVSVPHADAKGLSGTATCKGLRWADAMASDPLDQGFIKSEPPFDAEMTFQAAP